MYYLKKHIIMRVESYVMKIMKIYSRMCLHYFNGVILLLQTQNLAQNLL